MLCCSWWKRIRLCLLLFIIFLAVSSYFVLGSNLMYVLSCGLWIICCFLWLFIFISNLCISGSFLIFYFLVLIIFLLFSLQILESFLLLFWIIIISLSRVFFCFSFRMFNIFPFPHILGHQTWAYSPINIESELITGLAMIPEAMMRWIPLLIEQPQGHGLNLSSLGFSYVPLLCGIWELGI